MNKKVGFFGLLVVAAVSVFHPAVASAQNRDDDRRGYAQTDASDRMHRDFRQYDDRDFRQYDDRQFRQEWDRRFQRSDRRDEGYRAPSRDFNSGRRR